MTYEPKTKRTDASVGAFLERVEPESKRRDCLEITAMMEAITQAPATMWGPSIVGSGSYWYRYASGQLREWPVAGFSPRKDAVAIYLMAGNADWEDLMSRLGTFKTGKSCLYIKRLESVDRAVLHELITRSVAQVREAYPG